MIGGKKGSIAIFTYHHRHRETESITNSPFLLVCQPSHEPPSNHLSLFFSFFSIKSNSSTSQSSAIPTPFPTSSLLLLLLSVFNPLAVISRQSAEMGSIDKERTIVGLAATDPSGHLSPYTFTLRNTGPEDVFIKVMCCGVCHTDIHQVKNDLGMSRYPMVPGHEVIGEVVEVGSEVTKFSAGDVVGVGCLVGCCRSCRACDSDIEQYCNKKIWSYNDIYTDGKPTQGGFAESMVVDQKFVVKIPDGMSPEQAAPLLCAGVTVYSPLNHFGLKKPGLRGGILGLGGVGHMGVKIAKAMGHHITVISSSDKKRVEALDHLGADDYLVSSDAAKMQEVADSLDYIIDTVPVNHPLEPYLSLLKVDGKLILMGVINTPLQFISPMVMLGRKVITGSFIGSMKETEEMLDFCKEKGLSSMIEVVNMDYVNTALERLEKNDVRYRFVVDVAGSKLLQQ
ncbi:unnamed protein product [Linum tenue]|uniref:Enoyl reductase (ER) domain-containing protein n=1 Tax=Linum tenue TaxID=586396 RepID=A0AAV0RKJ3_9ROSI|nr:unnamed protein product [Linum tenue]